MTNDTALAEDLEARRCAAMIAADIPTLDTLFADDLNWCHSSGRVDDKAALLEKIQTGKSQYLNMEWSDQRYFITSEAIVCTGLVEMGAIVNGTEHQLSNRYATAWVKDGENWQLAVWQSTKTPA